MLSLPWFALYMFNFTTKYPDCNDAYLHLNIRFASLATRISSLFPFKEKVAKFRRSCLVYCSASYVG